MDNVQRRLDQCKSVIMHAYAVEIRAEISAIRNGVGKLQGNAEDSSSRSQEKLERELLEKLAPPRDSIYYGKQACLVGTRVSILKRIQSWALDDSSASRLFWLFGVAGCGKSAIAAYISGRLGVRLAGSFFCKRDQDERRDPVRLIWTIAFYLAEANAEFRRALLKALQKPDASVNLDLATQFTSLLEQPLDEASPEVPKGDSVVFVIDALDECREHAEAAKVLTQILHLAPWLKFVVASRRLPGISSALARLSALMTGVDLFAKDASGDSDIRKFLEHELSPDGRLADIAWFIEDRKEVFIDKSQNLFIWLDTIINFIAVDDGNFGVADEILGQKSTEAEGSLDTLYRAVIDSASDRSKTSKEVVRLTIGFVLASSQTEPLPAGVIHAFLPSSLLVPLGTVETILARLSDILILGAQGVVAVHTSVLDFSAD